MLNEYRFGDFYIRHAIDDRPEDAPFTLHIHDVCEIYLYVSGNVAYLVEGNLYALEENSIMVIRPAEVHKPKILGPERYERYAINFPLRFAEALDSELRLTGIFTDRALGENNKPSLSPEEAAQIRNLFTQMFQPFRDSYDRELTVKANLLTILSILYRTDKNRADREDQPQSTGQKIVVYVNRHIYEPVTIPALASHFFLSSSQFNRIFRQSTGASPWEYITIKRLIAAREKIRSGTPAYRAAEECGFRDYSAFYRAYTKYYGTAPTQK